MLWEPKVGTTLAFVKNYFLYEQGSMVKGIGRSSRQDPGRSDHSGHCIRLLGGLRPSLKAKGSNMQSAANHEEVVSAYRADEMEAGRVVLAGTPQEAQAMGIHCSPFGVISKKSKPGKFRLIVNLSAPEGSSVNDGIRKELASLSYVSVDEVAEAVGELGRGTLMSKMDICQAYRHIPVHPQDRFLLGMMWQGKVYVDTTLPFGLRSAPLIFTAVADAAQWVMHKEGASKIFHYIDDFITLGAKGSHECLHNSTVMHRTCERLGLPPEPDKDVGPTTCLVFTGIEIDSEAMELRLPGDKLTKLKAELSSWRGRKACKKRDLLSLIGVLSHACKVVRAGRTFLRRLIDLSMTVEKLEHFARRSREARSDMEWWHTFCVDWNGVAIMPSSPEARATVSVTSDASGTWGCGA